MRSIRPASLRFLLVPGLALAPASCTSAPEEASAREPFFDAHVQAAHHRTWTREFEEEAVFIADHIAIDGPSDLLSHVVVPQSPTVDYSIETTAEGLRQVVRRKPGAAGAVVRAQLDGWQLVATQSLTVLQRPGDAAVNVVGTGKAAWIPSAGGDERRGERLEFVGEHHR